MCQDKFSKTNGDRSFMYFAPLPWNQLPIDIKMCSVDNYVYIVCTLNINKV